MPSALFTVSLDLLIQSVEFLLSLLLDLLYLRVSLSQNLLRLLLRFSQDLALYCCCTHKHYLSDIRAERQGPSSGLRFAGNGQSKSCFSSYPSLTPKFSRKMVTSSPRTA